jgi:hypothetical protein
MGIFQKCSERDNFLNIFKWKLSSPYVLQSGALFVDHFPRSSRETAETETLLRRPRTATLPKKTQGFAPESVFTREFTRFRAVARPKWLQVVHMMMWLA